MVDDGGGVRRVQKPGSMLAAFGTGDFCAWAQLKAALQHAEEV